MAHNHPNTMAGEPQDFIPWMEAHRDEVPWKFHLLTKRHHVRVFLEGLHPAIVITVSAHELRITVEQDEEILDTLLWLEMSPARRGNAYVCTLCEPESPKRFASLAELREDHLYTPFLDWCQQALARATHLEILHTPGVTAAKLTNLQEQTKKQAGAPVKKHVARRKNQTNRWPLFT